MAKNELYQVIRTRIRDPEPNQVLEMSSYPTVRAAEAAYDILCRRPEVKQGKEIVRIVKHIH